VQSAGFVFAVACVGLVAGGLVGGQLTAALRRTGGSRLRYCLVLPGLCLVGAGVVGSVAGFGAVFLLPVLAGLVAFVLGGVVGMMVRTRYVRAVCADSTPAVSWTAETSQAAKRRRYAIVFGLSVLAVGGIILDLIGQYGVSPYVPFLSSVMSGLLGIGMRSETMHAHETGIEVERPINRGFIPWNRISGYNLSETELQIELAYRPDYRCDRAQIDDVDAVVEALDNYVAAE
jgi:MFS family permease